MLDKLISKYALTTFLETESCAFAITDEDSRIIWYNRSFKDFFGKQKIKGRSFQRLFKFTEPIDINSIEKPVHIKFHRHHRLTITPLKEQNKSDGFFLEINTETRSETASNKTNTDITAISQQELNDILSLLVKEKSIDVLTDEILLRCVTDNKSTYGIAVLYKSSNQYDFYFSDYEKQIKNVEDVKAEIKSNLTFINKWMEVNRTSLIAHNDPRNLGYNLVQALQCQSIVVSPCFFDNNHLATIIICNSRDNFLPTEIASIESYSALLAFSISNIRTKELNAALETRLMQSQKLETIGKLSSGMAHDFNNLLSSIFGSINLLKKRVPQQDNIIRLLDNIESCSVRAKDLTRGLLSYGKPTPKRKEQIKPNKLLGEIAKVITQTFPADVEFEESVDENLYDILGNGTEVYQVLLNLCVNAKEAIEGKGKITLTGKNLTVDDSNLIEYPGLSKGNYVLISVKDNGSGIDEKNLQRIFDPYFSTKQKETGSGSGLGLYVTYGIIKAHKGYVEVSSKINQGTVFDVYLPAYEPAKASSKSPAEKIILLADDEVMLRELLADLLESSGYNVVKVTSGEEVIKVLTEEIMVNLAILDYNMPGMNGLECIEKIRELKIDIPVILSSGSLSVEAEIDIKKLGIGSILSKPYEFETMLETIQKLL